MMFVWEMQAALDPEMYKIIWIIVQNSYLKHKGHGQSKKVKKKIQRISVWEYAS